MTLNPETQQFIKENINKDVNALLLMKNTPPGVDIKFAVQQIEARKKAVTKLPSLCANERFIFPSRLSMEQCSSEPAAKYKSRFVTGGKVADITGGFGIDAIYMSERAEHLVYIEQNEALAEMAAYNFSLLDKRNVTIVCDDSLHYLEHNTESDFDCIYVDPARRNNRQHKTVLFADCTPDVKAHRRLLLSRAKTVLIKASPMLDITQAVKDLEYGVVEIHIVSVKNECKELLFLCRKGEFSPDVHCVNLFNDREPEIFSFSFREESESEARYAREVQSYIYEPNASVMKSGAFKLVCKRFDLRKLHPNTHLYTGNELHENFPGRIFETTDIFSPSDAAFRHHLPLKQADITVRNYPLSVSQIRNKYKIKEGGNIYLFAVTTADDKKAMIKCGKVKRDKG
ncbi:MAG: class I SAM-dependent methyltransferase [Candidatus Azobacteroides sp.]|nr:class I SAM-dependent methyltransferase [Candidatus Azobacteroides sp.]